MSLTLRGGSLILPSTRAALEAIDVSEGDFLKMGGSTPLSEWDY